MSAPSTLSRRPAGAWITLGWILLALVTLALLDHRLRFTWNHAINVLFWDQWDLYNPLFRRDGWWGVFSYQHGPHRQGLGGLAIAALAPLTAWDVRWDAVLTVLVTGLAALAALPLARLCGVRSPWRLWPVPFIFLTARQYEAWVGPANPAHGAFPLLLAVALCLTWFDPQPIRRAGCQVLAIFLLAFTGFGLFAAAGGTMLLAVGAWHDRRSGAAGSIRLVTLLTVGAAWALFFWRYENQPAVPDFRFPYERPWEYFSFSALMFASYADLYRARPWDLVFGTVVLLALVGVVCRAARELRRSPPEDAPVAAVVFTMGASALLYCLSTAFGRVTLGWQEAPYAPRYVTLLVPAYFALYLALERAPSAAVRLPARVGFIALLGWSCVTVSPSDLSSAEGYRRGRSRWREVYLQTGDLPQAAAATAAQGFKIYPGEFAWKVDYLRRHRLNFCKPDPFALPRQPGF